jgi:hypothetical protein
MRKRERCDAAKGTRPAKRRRPAVVSPEDGDEGGTALASLPVEILHMVLLMLPARCVVRVGMTCARLATVARADALWARLYARDFATRAPSPEHADHALHGKDVRWLYVATRNAPPRLTCVDPATRRLVGTVVAPDGATIRGEFDVAPDGRGLVVDGYAARTHAAGRVDEGVWRQGALAGPARSADSSGCEVRCDRWAGGSPTGRAAVRYADGSTYEGDLVGGMRTGVGCLVSGARLRGVPDAYVGEWHEDRRCGRGYVEMTHDMQRHRAGPRYVWSGQWACGVLHGPAVWRSDQGYTVELRADAGLDPHDDPHTNDSWVRIDRASWKIARRTAPCAAGGGAGDDGDDARPHTTRRVVPLREPWPRTCIHTYGDAATASSCAGPAPVVERVHIGSARGHWRVRRADGSLAVGSGSRLLLVAVGDSCADRTIAGARLFFVVDPPARDGEASVVWCPHEAAAAALDAKGQVDKRETAHFDGAGTDRQGDDAPQTVVSMAAPTERVPATGAGATDRVPVALLRECARVLASPRCPLPSATASLGLDAVSRLIASGADAARAEPSAAEGAIGGVGLPCGAPLAAAGAPREVRCFLTGSRVPVDRCVMLASGRLYEASAARRWLSSGPHGDYDPETGEVLSVRLAVGWMRWMERAPFAVVRRAARSAMHAARFAGAVNARGDRHPAGWRRAAWLVEDAVRAAVLSHLVDSGGDAFDDDTAGSNDSAPTAATATTTTRTTTTNASAKIEKRHAPLGGDGSRRCLTPRGASHVAWDEATDAARAARLARRLCRGFDLMRIEHVEFHDVRWDPRGPYRFGPPRETDRHADPTLMDHERTRGPDDPPDAHLAKAGIVRVALASPSFALATLTDVFFFGHAFVGASFAGATLDRCAFVCCRFRDCTFGGAVMVGCGLYDCEVFCPTDGSWRPVVHPSSLAVVDPALA